MANKPKPKMLGTGYASKAAKKLKGRSAQIERELQAALGIVKKKKKSK